MSLKTYALTTVARFKAFAGLTGLSAAQDTVIEILINSLTEYVENYCQRRFMKTAYSNEVYDGDGSRELYLKEYPVISGETFTLQDRSTGSNQDDWGTISSSEYFVDNETGIVEFAGKSRKFRNSPQAYRVTYTSGFDFDNALTFLADTEAGDVEYAMWKLLKTAWDKRKGQAGVVRERLGDYSVEYAKNVFESPEIKEVLDKYARVSAGGNRSVWG